MQFGLTLFLAGAALLNVYALVLVLVRAPLYRTRLYRPMLLNIGLSIAPIFALVLTLVAMAVAGSLAPGTPSAPIVLALGALVWLLLLPNSAYLITELNFSHRRDDDPTPLWYDIVLTLALALSGIVNALLNVVLAQILYTIVTDPTDTTMPFSTPGSWVFVGVVLILVSVGVYLGRYIRFNSWDLLHPLSFVRKLWDHLSKPRNILTMSGFTLVHAALLGILYLLVVAPLAIAVS